MPSWDRYPPNNTYAPVAVCINNRIKFEFRLRERNERSKRFEGCKEASRATWRAGVKETVSRGCCEKAPFNKWHRCACPLSRDPDVRLHNSTRTVHETYSITWCAFICRLNKCHSDHVRFYDERPFQKSDADVATILRCSVRTWPHLFRQRAKYIMAD